MRKDAEQIDGRVGETFSGIRVVRAFGREMRELLDYMRGRHTVLRKELFAHRRELVIWTSWGLLLSARERRDRLVRRLPEHRGSASIGDIMAFQWYMFLLLNPVCPLDARGTRQPRREAPSAERPGGTESGVRWSKCIRVFRRLRPSFL